ncbi:MAG TPA: glycosyltransferase family 39 protein [Gemmatimonadaceae bacterium]|nr:glycosyltransferase family 39 protein [Gemmatimonadaceae bacterium]
MAWIAGASLGAWYLRRGWVPHDEGALAQSAERLLAGQLPHRDFDEIYTGGLTMLHAAAFRAFGENLWSMRVVLFAVFLAFLPAVYAIARRFVGANAAALATFTAAAWTLPNYSAPIPSWYNLFLATIGMAALLRHVDTQRRRWLVVAGVAGGLSCLAKITGLYFVGAAGLFLVYREAVLSRDASDDAPRHFAFTAATIAAVAMLALAVALLVRMRAGLAGIVNFVLPVVALVLAVGAGLAASRGEQMALRGRRLIALLWPFAVGVAAPVALFVLPYLATGSLGALWNGVFVLPTKRFAFASMGLLPVSTMRYAVLLTVFAWWAKRWSASARQWGGIGVGLLLLWFLLHARHPQPYEIVWYTTRALLPLSVLAGAVLLLARREPLSATREQELVLVLSVAALCSLIQFPFAAPIYFIYVSPLALLAALAVWRTWDPAPQPTGAVVLSFWALFALLWVNTGFIYAMGINHVRDRQDHLLDLPRGGLRVTIEDQSTYERAVAAVRAHAHGDYIWAGPDAPAVYFLSATRNPTRTLFDFFDEPTDRTPRLLAALDRHDVHVIVLHSRPPFSGPLDAALRDSLRRRFPASETAGWFEIRWRP